MKRFRLTTPAKIFLVGLVIALVGGGAFYGVKSGFIKTEKPVNTPPAISVDNEKPSKPNKPSADKNPQKPTDANTIDISLDEWIMWKPLIDANGGLTTQPGSIYDQLGLDVNINIINDAAQSSNALIKGQLDAAGYTTNRMAFLSGKIQSAGFDAVVPVFCNYSSGGDGIIATTDIKSVEDFLGAKIGVPKFSEAHTLVAWFVNNSDLTDAEKSQILDNLILFDTPSEAGEAFFSGKIDVAATWQPYLSQAESSTNSHILFDTTASKTLVMDGILFSRDFAENNPESVTKLIDGMFQAADLLDKDFDAIRNTMPMVASSSDEEIKAMLGDGILCTYHDNMDILKMDAPMVFQDMCDVWTQLGETTDPSIVSKLFDASYIEPLKDKYNSITPTEKPTFAEDQKTSTQDAKALLTKSCTINFMPDTAKFLDNTETAAQLEQFISVAKILDGTIIQIEGNINASIDTPEGRKLSEERAKSVSKYFIANGIDPNRIIVIGNGNSKMLGDMNTEEGKIKNRRTDVFFKTVEE